MPHETKPRSGKKYNITEEDFCLFQSEVNEALERLGLRLPVDFVLGVPEDMDEYVVAGTIIYESNQKVTFFLNPELKKKPTHGRLKYLALHEVIEFLLTDRFVKLISKGKRMKNSEWEETVHDVLNRLVCLVSPELLGE